jgi:hypothetical protein
MFPEPNPQRCWASTHLTDRGYPLNRGLSCYNMESPSLNHNGWYVWRLEWHTPCTVKIFSVDFDKRVGACIVLLQKANIFKLFQWHSKLLSHPSLFFLVFRFCCACSSPEYECNICLWMLSNQQPINMIW